MAAITGKLYDQKEDCTKILAHGYLSLPQFDDPHRVHQLHDGISRVYLEPAFGKIGIVWLFMVIVLEQFAHHQEIEWQSIFAVIVVIVVRIAVFVPTPIHDGAVYRSH